MKDQRGFAILVLTMIVLAITPLFNLSSASSEKNTGPVKDPVFDASWAQSDLSRTISTSKWPSSISSFGVGLGGDGAISFRQQAAEDALPSAYYTVAGRVIDTAGNPIVKAAMYAYRVAGEQFRINASNATVMPEGEGGPYTDSNGNYSMVLPDGDWLIKPSKLCYDLYDPLEGRLVHVPPDATGIDIVMKRAICPYSISGRVTDKAQHGIEAFVQAEGPDYAYMQTASDGTYTLSDLREGTYTVSAYKEGWDSSSNQELSVPPHRDNVNFVLEQPDVGKRAVVFVHGWVGFDPSNTTCQQADPDGYFEQVDDLLREAGYYVGYAFLRSSPCYTPPIEANVWNVNYAIEIAKARTNQSRVILIAHSMGGLVARAYIEGPSYDNDVSELFTFGSPHQGAPVDFLVWLGGGPALAAYCISQPVACEFSITGMAAFNQRYPMRVAGVTYHAISGDAPFAPRTALGAAAGALLLGGDDGAVQTSSGKGLTGWVDRWTTDETHSNMIGPRNYFLRDGWLSTSYVDCLMAVLVDSPAKKFCGTYGSSSTAMTGGEEAQTDMPATRHGPLLRVNLKQGQTYNHSVAVEGGSAVFAAQWPAGAGLAFTLMDPAGQVIDPAYAAAHPTIMTYLQSDGYASYALTNAAAGTWQMVLQATSAAAGGTVYTALAAFESGTSLSGSTDRTWYAPGSSAVISTILSPAPQSATVSARIVHADGSSTSISLTSLGGGQFRGSYPVPDKPGYAEMQLEGAGVNAGGVPFELGASLAFQIMPSTITLTGAYSDTPEPRWPGASVYDALAVAAGVNASQDAWYGLSADLVDGSGNFVAHASARDYLYSGAGTLTLRFAGTEIFQAKHDGPYTLTHLMLTDESGAVLVAQEAQNVHATAAYRYWDFRSGGVFLPLVMK